MAASLDDILTTQKNGVVGINGIVSTIGMIVRRLFPSAVSPTVLGGVTQLITTGSGRLFAVSIPVHSGSAQFYVYDSATTAGISASNLIFASLPSNASTFTPYQDVNLPYTNGIVVVADSGLNGCVAYLPL